MLDKKYRRYGSMKNAKELKIQVADTTLTYLEHRSYVGQQTQVGYGKAIDDLCRDFQGLLREHQQLLSNYRNLLDKYSAVCAQFNLSQKPEEVKAVSGAEL
jgi:hypothetical protein